MWIVLTGARTFLLGGSVLSHFGLEEGYGAVMVVSKEILIEVLARKLPEMPFTIDEGAIDAVGVSCRWCDMTEVVCCHRRESPTLNHCAHVCFNEECKYRLYCQFDSPREEDYCPFGGHGEHVLSDRFAVEEVPA
jgi:hypothetical protein